MKKWQRNMLLAPYVLLLRVPIVIVCNLVIKYGPKAVGLACRIADKLPAFER